MILKRQKSAKYRNLTARTRLSFLGGGLYCLFECVVITFNVGEDQVAKSQLASRVYLLYYIIDSNFLSSSRVTGLVPNCSKLLWS